MFFFLYKSRKHFNHLCIISIFMLFCTIDLYGHAKISPIDRTRFWEIINNSIQDTPQNTKEVFKENLKSLNSGEVLQFSIILNMYTERTKFPAMEMAFNLINGSLINNNLADNNFQERDFFFFSCWVISQGEDIYFEALKNPDILANIDVKRGEGKFWGYDIVLNEFFEESNPMELIDYVLSDDQLSEIDRGTIFDEDKYHIDYKEFYNLLPKELPKLYEKYWDEIIQEKE